MNDPKQKIIVFIFCIIVIAHLAGTAYNLPLMHFIAKPMLMPALMLLLFFSPSIVAHKKLLLTGLFFSWLGDVLLLFENRHALFFYIGFDKFFNHPYFLHHLLLKNSSA